MRSSELLRIYLNPDDKTHEMNKDEVNDEEEEINLSIDIVDIVSSSDSDDLTKSEKVKSIQKCELKEDYLEEDKILTYGLKDDSEIRE